MLQIVADLVDSSEVGPFLTGFLAPEDYIPFALKIGERLALVQL